MNELHSSTARRIKAIEAAITGNGMTAKEIGVAVHLCHDVAIKYMNYLHDHEQKRVYIAGWRQCGTNTRAAVYRWGSRKDAEKPRPMTGAEARLAYRERIRKDAERNDLYLARQRALDRASRAAKRPSTWLTALGVPEC